MNLPAEVNLSGIMYRIQESEGLITFTELYPIWSCGRKICFQKKESCWYVEILGTHDNSIMVSHLVKAYDLVERAYGGNFANLAKGIA